MANLIIDLKERAFKVALQNVIIYIADRFQEKQKKSIGLGYAFEQKLDPDITAEKLISAEESIIYGFILNKFQDESFIEELKEYKEQEVG